MSPLSIALAVLLHALVAAGLWWLAQHKPPGPSVEEAITVSFEQPKPPDLPPPEPLPQQVPLPQTLPPILGVRPPASIIAERPTQVPPTDQESPVLPSESKSEPSPSVQPEAAPPTPEPAVEARVEAPPAPAEKPTPEPPAEQGLKPAPMPPTQPAAPSPQPAKPAEPVPVPKPLPQQQALAPPPRQPPPAQTPDLKPSPLATAPTRRPPSASEPPSQHRFVNPADVRARATVTDNYLSEVLRKIVGYRYQTISQRQQGVTVVRVVIARDGRLLSATVVSSSGEPEFDNGVLAGVRAGAPYSPLPDSIKGASAPFDLPIVSVRR